jgi:hypothetical protein
MTGFSPRFLPRERPLVPVAVAIPRARVRRLLDRWQRDTRGLEALRAVGASSCLILSSEGDAEALPWVDGACYLGRDPQAPRLLVPTALCPDIPYGLFERALFARSPAARAPAALLLDPLRLVDAASPRPFDPAALGRWLEARGP